MSPTTRLLAALPLLALPAGCATATPRLEAPAAWGAPLAEARQAAPGAPADAEAHLARGGGGAAPWALDPAAGHEGELERLLAARPTLRVPCRLAVVEAHRPCERWVEPAWGAPRLEAGGEAWALRPPLPAALGELRAGLDPLAAAGAGLEWPRLEAPRRDPFAAIDALPGLLLPARATPCGARGAAARIGADAVLVFAAAARLYEWRNGWANLYPTLAGLLLPGESRAAVVRAEAALLDVRTGAVLAVAQAEARRELERSPLQGGGPEEEARLLEEASVAATRGLAGELRRALAGLEAAGRFAPAAGEGAK